MTDPEARPRPDGSAWREAQQRISARNDEARKRGRQERAETDRKQAVQRLAAERNGIYR